MIRGDDVLLQTITEQEEQISTQAKRIRTMAEEITLLRAGENADRCVMCGAIVPEGRQVCPVCLKAPQEDEEDV